MEINLEGQILVLDEAHNIEDCARESASFTLNHNNLLMSRDELDSMVNNNIRRSKHEPLRDFCYSLIKLVLHWRNFAHWSFSLFEWIFTKMSFSPLCSWIQESQSLMSERGYESACKVWNGKDILGIFHSLGITAATFSILKVHQKSLLYL